MTARTIRAGKTHDTNGTIGADDTLLVQGGPGGGGAGGTAVVTTSLSNSGTIIVSAGAMGATGQSGGLGGQLDVRGVLVDSGVITVKGGEAGYTTALQSSQGGTLSVSGTLSVAQPGLLTVSGSRGGEAFGSGRPITAGVLVNTGMLGNAGSVYLDGGGSAPYDGFAGYGAALNNAGTLVNAGMLMVAGGRLGGLYADGGYGASLTDTGVLTNSGLLEVGGSAGAGYLARGGTGGTLTVASAGVLTNNGSILLEGGGAVSYSAFYAPGNGGVLFDQGRLTNSGTIEIASAVSKDNHNGGTGGQLMAAGTLTSTGTILVDGSASVSNGTPGGGGVLTLSGTLTTSGLLSIAAGGASSTYNDPGRPGMLIDTSFLTNTGQLTVEGGLAGHATLTKGSAGGTLSVNGYLGELNNDGTLTVAGGQGARFIGYQGGSAAGTGGLLLLISGGVLFDDGLVELKAGSQGSGSGLAGTGALLDDFSLLQVNDTLLIDAGAGATEDARLVVTGDLDITYHGTLVNGGSITLEAGCIVSGDGFSAKGGLFNTGAISASGAINNLIISNAGVIDVGAGSLSMNGDIVQSSGGPGSFLVGDGGLLQLFNSTLDSLQTVVLAGPGATVTAQASPAAAAAVLIDSAEGGRLELFGYGYGVATLNAADTNLSVFLADPTNLTLSRMSAIAVSGSSGNDTITALSSGQTLTGAGGLDFLTGAAATGDLFRDTALGLNGDTIADFAGTDVIDITNIASGPAFALAYVQQGDHGLLSLSNGSATTTITLQGQFTPASFTTSTDGHGGVLIGLHG